MPTITVFTDDENLANNVAEYKPFTVGDATDAWTVKFNNGSSFYAPSGVSMKVGHVNGLPDGTYNDAFLFVDRFNNRYRNSITVSSGVPNLGAFGTFKLRRSVNNPFSVDIPYGASAAVVQKALNDTSNGGISADTYDAIVTRNSINEYEINKTLTGKSDVIGELTNFPSSSSITNISAGFPHRVDVITIINTGTAPTQPYIGSNGVYILKGFNPPIDVRGRIGNIGLLTGGAYDSAVGTVAFTATGTGSGFGANAVESSGTLTNLTLQAAGSGYSNGTIVTASNSGTRTAVMGFDILDNPSYQVPFMDEASGMNILAATTLSPSSTGEIQDVTEFNDSSLIIRPRDIATASLSQSGTDFVGTMNPINNYVLARLALRGSTQIDLQIFGNNQMLFQGKLTILNKIA